MKTENPKTYTPQIFVSGHRNPDIDSIAGAVALAELRRRQGVEKVSAVCPGMLPDKAVYLFNRFNMALPAVRNDVYVRVRDIQQDDVPAISGGSTLFDAVMQLRESGLSRLPVTDKSGRFLGMLSGMSLLTKLLKIDNDDGSGLTGRRIHTSIELIRQVLEAKVLNGRDTGEMQDFEVYVAAMSLDGFDAHLPENNEQLAMIVGDRPDIHLRAIGRKMRLLIITGDRPVDKLILQGARESGVSILQSKLDSATVIRRLKFSVPVEFSDFPELSLVLSPGDRLTDIRPRLMNQAEDVFPVVEKEKLCGTVLKRTLSAPAPFNMILVDHNEVEQSIPGVSEVPVIEVVDHHRIGMNPTATPIKFTGDVVGSSCTLVTSMYRAAGESLTPAMAGILLGGIVSDTLLLKSPTTAELDRRMVAFLEKISGIKGADLMNELMRIDSALAAKSASEVLCGDRKDYTDGNCRFALAQVEESDFELLHERCEELSAEIREFLVRDNLDFFGLLVTDAVRENSQLLAIGSAGIVGNLPYDRIAPDIYALPGVLSRKKQLLPQMLAITAALREQY